MTQAVLLVASKREHSLRFADTSSKQVILSEADVPNGYQKAHKHEWTAA